jgi:hypothetical protein
MRMAVVPLIALGLGGCMLDPATDNVIPRAPVQSSELEPIDPYHRDKVPDTPYEIRKAEQERDDHLAGRTGPTYPPFFRNQKDGTQGRN